MKVLILEDEERVWRVILRSGVKKNVTCGVARDSKAKRGGVVESESKVRNGVCMEVVRFF